MPLVRIDIHRNPDPTLVQRAGKVVYDSLRSTINVPEHDNFQILGEHETRHFIYDPQYLGIERTNALVIIQITLSEGRTTEQKKLLYKTIVEGLHAQLGLRTEDVLINLVETRKENWSFGNGLASYAL